MVPQARIQGFPLGGATYFQAWGWGVIQMRANTVGTAPIGGGGAAGAPLWIRRCSAPHYIIMDGLIRMWLYICDIVTIGHSVIKV